MERYHSLYFISIIGPAVLGLIALALIALPGDPSTGRMLVALAVYLTVVIGGAAIMTRRLDR
ncbi:hypothetical protein ABZT16_11545 [Streptomyces flaveolus]|uniref:hypothetical protein n=1 Tax=Streptomyces flaveolus TaxID=67297 RepID=UPI0033BDE18A